MPGWVGGIKFLTDLYKDGLAPKDSVNWGFNEIVAGFYSGTCAMLDQDPDALIAIAERMKAEDFAVAPMPKGPDGKSFPTIGYAGWAMFSDSEHKEEAWKLIAHALVKPASDVTWNKRVGALPIYTEAEKDPFYAGPQFKGWFEELGRSERAADGRCRPIWRSSPSSRTLSCRGRARKPCSASARRRTSPRNGRDYLTEAQQKFMASKQQ